MPFWKAEALDRDFHFAEHVGRFLEYADNRLDSPDFSRELMDDYFMDESAAETLIGFLKFQRESTRTDLPHRHHILAERVESEQGANPGKPGGDSHILGRAREPPICNGSGSRMAVAVLSDHRHLSRQRLHCTVVAR